MIISLDAEALLEGLKIMDRVYDSVPMARHARETGWATIEECRQLVQAVQKMNQEERLNVEVPEWKVKEEANPPRKLPDPPLSPSIPVSQIPPTLPLD